MARCCSQRECVAWSRGRHLFSTRLSLSLSPFLSLSIRSDRYGPKIESWHRESDISRPIYITRRATRLPYVRFQASVHMYACIARGLASRSSFRYPLASRLFEGRRRAALGFPFIDASSSTTRDRGESVRRFVPLLPLSLSSGTDRPASGASHYHLGHFLFRGPRLNGPSNARPCTLVPRRCSNRSGTVDTRD